MSSAQSLPVCLYHTGPVTALHSVEDYVIAGVGSHLYIYDVVSKICLKRECYLPFRCIHGIVQGFDSTSLLCIYGEKCCRILKINFQCSPGNVELPLVTDDNRLEVELTSHMIDAEDWIWCAQFLNKDDEEDVVLALGHNVVVRWHWRTDTIHSRVCCIENSILYSASFIGRNWENLILAAGTVYNQVLLWSPCGDKRSDDSHVTVIQRLTGHQGVIFSIDYLNERHQICSVSDDRSLRLYQLVFSDRCNQTDPLGSFPSLREWQNCSCHVLQVMYGHSARVWDVRLLSTSIISIGEDSTCCVWDYCGKIKQKFKGHKGKSIWSLTVNKEEEYVITGGGDASIRVWTLQGDVDISHAEVQQSNFSLPDNQVDGDFPRSVAMLNWEHFVVTTDNGDLYIHNIMSGEWQRQMTDPAFKSYAIMSVSPYQKNMILLGSITGTLRLLWADNLECDSTMKWKQTDWSVYNGKVFSIQWLQQDTIITTGPEGTICLWQLIITDDVAELNKIKEFCLPYCKQRWVSAAALVLANQLLVCGDRGGTIHVYHLEHRGQSPEGMSNPVQSFAKIHGKAGVTHVYHHGDEVYTSGRDGQYRKYSIENDQLVLLTSSRVYKGFEWIEKLSISDQGDIYIYGFQSSDFVLWSVDRNQKLVQISCGGGHRTWDCHIQGNIFSMIYLKARNIVLCKVDMWKNQVLLKEGLHGRELTCIKYLAPFSTDGCLVVTGSEDTGILVSVLCDNERNVMCLNRVLSLQGHISNVRTSAICNSGIPQCNRRRKLIFSGGGRAQLIVWRLTFPDQFESKEQTKLCFSESLCNFMLGQDMRPGRTRSWKLQQIKCNPETRFMELSAVQVASVWEEMPPYLHIVSAACSDGFVRIFLFNEDSKELHIVSESDYHDHCVLKVTYLLYQRTIIVLSTATDGCIAFWNVTSIVRNAIHKKYFDILIASKEDSPNIKADGPNIKADGPNIKADGPNIKADGPNVKADGPNIKADGPNIKADGPNIKADGPNVKLDGPTIKEGCSDLWNKQMKQSVCAYITCDVTEVKEDVSVVTMVPCYTTNCHQSGINAVHIDKYSDCEYLIASGGDDNALHITIVSLNTSNNDVYISVSASGQKLDAHSTQITGVHILSSSQVMSTSIDQRMCIWGLRREAENIKVHHVCTKYISTSDVSSMDVWKDRFTGVLIGGQGLSYFHV